MFSSIVERGFTAITASADDVGGAEAYSGCCVVVEALRIIITAGETVKAETAGSPTRRATAATFMVANANLLMCANYYCMLLVAHLFGMALF